ncbi:MAG: polyribonucleotide nucleotidyltransferase [Proteobacteria bacterium]|nr:polyribonucleotide nucleotidyltransferase [Pseudomonadota bacterium]
MKKYSKSLIVGGRELIITTGHWAKQASGACTIQYGDTVALVTAVVGEKPLDGVDFLPLICDYVEKTYSAGKIPGGFFKREGKPSEREVLVSRLIDRPIRPMFPKGFFNEVQIISTVLSLDQENDPDVLSIVGASFALELSGAPFEGPIAGVRVGMIDNNYVINPTVSQLKDSILDVVVAGSEEAIVMVEGKAKFVSEEVFIGALEFAHSEIKKIVHFQKEFINELGIKKSEFRVPDVVKDIESFILSNYSSEFEKSIYGKSKAERRVALSQLVERIYNEVKAQYPDPELDIWIKFGIEKAEKQVIRKNLLDNNKRIDGRGPEDIREITCEIGVLPRTHGSAVFTRGETQALVVTTLGTSEDEQRIDALFGESFKSFMLHYNFPPFCTGEIKPLRSPGRREIGHGALAERAISQVMPDEKEFPYTVRVVSDVLESNGSSSMATVCGSSLSLMDAGVPIKEHVAGIAMGLIKEGDKYVVLSDILGDEDHIGDMDFKVCGTTNGIVAVQMDMKVYGLTRDILAKALEQARKGRLFILEKMRAVIDKPKEISIYAPRVYKLQIKPEKIRDLIGPGGKNIKGIIEQTGVSIDVSDDGKVNVFSSNAENAEKAIELIKKLTFEPELGGIYMGRVTKIVDFGAFVQLSGGVEGLLHISQIDNKRIKNVSDVLKEGDEILVKVIDIDQTGRIKLSRKEVLGGSET